MASQVSCAVEKMSISDEDGWTTQKSRKDRRRDNGQTKQGRRGNQNGRGGYRGNQNGRNGRRGNKKVYDPVEQERIRKQNVLKMDVELSHSTCTKKNGPPEPFYVDGRVIQVGQLNPDIRNKSLRAEIIFLKKEDTHLRNFLCFNVRKGDRIVTNQDGKPRNGRDGQPITVTHNFYAYPFEDGVENDNFPVITEEVSTSTGIILENYFCSQDEEVKLYYYQAERNEDCQLAEDEYIDDIEVDIKDNFDKYVHYGCLCILTNPQFRVGLTNRNTPMSRKNWETYNEQAIKTATQFAKFMEIVSIKEKARVEKEDAEGVFE